MQPQSSPMRLYSLAEFAALPDDGKRYELVDGKIVEAMGGNEQHGRVGSLLLTFLGYFVFQHKLGNIYGPDTDFQIGRNARLPDVAFVAKGRLLPADRGKTVIPVAPNLAVEVRSPGDTKTEVADEVRQYQEAGVKLIWVINLRNETVEVYHPTDTKATVLKGNEELDGETVVPGFKLKVSNLFEYE